MEEYILEYIFEDVVIKPSNAPKFLLDGEEVDIWGDELEKYHSRSIIDYVRENLLSYERRGEDPFAEIVGKEVEKEMVKNALMSGSNILFKGRKGYGKTTFSKAMAKLLPEKLLAVKGCKIHDDPTHPTCFSCKKKLLEEDVVELTWVPRKWIRISGDPMMTTRQLIGGISIQKVKEGYDLDHPEVFTPGRVLKAHRGMAYFDELGAIPSALQTLLHELLEERQITTPEGDIVPMKIDTLFVASTNPANYKGVADIKEPLMDRVEEIPIGPPETLKEEIEIGLRNMSLKEGAILPLWHLKILARTVRYARSNELRVSGQIELEPSCRATIKLFDHLRASATRKGHTAAMLMDYGERYEVVKLGMRSRIELEYDDGNEKDAVIEKLVEEAINRTCSEIYALIPRDSFSGLMEELSSVDEIDVEKVNPKEFEYAWKAILLMARRPEEVNSAFEILLESVSRCTGLIEKVSAGRYAYVGA
ncbi:AAA family ATPase [Archaeoglobus veneficus]|uniref:ATPase associated with various cellular activities AAA_5 n=1 Tax=Archaeoglobus veneficus (strain DSM 11195 / SNP6) TaxID=693661 RepID=F2KTD3_ARCVS|nr:AAA family ATPase [Archaeoglobus veneficus]AEA47163.1 ATPase associated with various cellular activities AAA_5 [Archaeoglobus veneficus SNP6]